MRVSVASPLLVLVACNDAALTKFNSTPTAAILSPADGAALLTGPAALSGQAADANHDAAELRAAWWVDGAEVCPPAAPAADGATDCTATLAPGSREITLIVEDPGGDAATDTVRVTVGDTEAPVAEIRGPDAAARWYAGDLLTLAGWVGDAESPPDALRAAWSSSLAGVLVADLVPAGDGTVDAFVTLPEGAHGITLEVVDPDGKIGRDTLALTVGPANRAPGCGVLEPTDGEVVPWGTDLALRGYATDADEPAEGLAAVWASDLDGPLGTATPAADGAVLGVASGLRAGTHLLSLTVTDERGERCADAVAVTVGSPPVVQIDAPLDGAIVNEGTPVGFAATLSDPDDAAPTLGLVWESTLDGVLDTAPADAAGQAGFTALSLARGTHTVSLAAADPGGLVGTDAVTFRVNGLPGGLALQIDPRPAGTADDLVATVISAATDPEGDPVSLSIAWTRDGLATAHTGLTVPASATSRGERWEITVTPADPYGAGTPATAAITIDNSAPVATSLSLTPSAPRTDDTLVATAAGTDADGDPVGFAYAWEVDGVSTGTTGSTLAGTAHFAKGQVVAVTATPTDGAALGASLRASVTVENTPPTAPGVTISPARPTTTDDLLCAVSTPSTDADGDPITYTFAWTVDGVDYPADTPDTGIVWVGPGTTTWPGDTVPAEDAALGSTWVCTVTPDDGDDLGPSGSATVETSTACSGGTVRVAWVSGWGSGWADSSLAWNTLSSSWSSYGGCALSFTNVFQPFTAATLASAAPDVILLGDVGGGTRTLSAAEMSAIEAYVQAGNAGVLITYALSYSSYTANARLAPLAGVNASALSGSSGTITNRTTMVDPTHPLFTGVSTSPFTAVTFLSEQGRTVGSWSAALRPGASIVGGTTGQNTLITYTGSAWRGVFITGMMEYQNAGVDARQVLYNSLMWAAGYGP